MSKRPIRWFASFAFTVLAAGADAADIRPDNDAKVTAAEMVAESADCYAYYAVSGHCVSHDAPTSLNASLPGLLNQLSNQMYVLAKAAGMKTDAVAAEVRMSLTSQKEQLGNECLNLAILIDQYGQKCKALVEHPDSRASEILKQQRLKH